MLLRRLAVFAGGWTLEAAEAVVRRGGGSPRRRCWTCWPQLVDKSLVLAEHGRRRAALPAAGDDAPVRRGAAARGGRGGAVRAARRALPARWPSRRERELRGRRRRLARRGWSREHDNLRAALEWCRAGPGGRNRACGWRARCGGSGGLRPPAEGRRWLDDALVGSEAAAPDARVRALNGAGNLAYAQGDSGAPRRYTRRPWRSGARWAISEGSRTSLNNLAALAQAQGDYARAATLRAEGLALRRALPGDQQGIAASLNNLATVAQQRGDSPGGDAARGEPGAAPRAWRRARDCVFAQQPGHRGDRTWASTNMRRRCWTKPWSCSASCTTRPTSPASLDRLGTG